MRGMGEIGATVSLIVAGVTLATAVVAANGQWELSTDKLPEGKYDITLSIEDNAGNRKEEVHEIFIDRTPPSAPVVTYSDIVNDLIIMQGTAEAKSQLIITDSEEILIRSRFLIMVTGVRQYRTHRKEVHHYERGCDG